MSKAAQASFFFGSYVVLVGAVLVFAPNVLLSNFGFPSTEEPWIRVLGVVAATLGGYYVQAGRLELTSFFRMTVVGRPLVFVGFTALVLAGHAAPPLILFGTVDLLGAGWSAWALRATK